MRPSRRDSRPEIGEAVKGAVRAVSKALFAGTCAASLFSLPLQAADTTSADQPIQEVIITGSRIPVPANITATSPIQVVSSQEIKLQGTTDVADLINNLPQNITNNAVDFTNTQNPLTGPGGLATADLRGLGPQRTLVLVNGRRLGAGDANTGNPNPAPDLDQIPTQLIERVDVVTGGASAVYGSDAVGGVINFIMKKDFEGVQVDAQYGFDQHRNHEDSMNGLLAAQNFGQAPGSVIDGRNKDISIILGANGADGKSNVTAYLDYHDAAPVSQGSRDFSACKVNGGPKQPFICNGSPNSNFYAVNLGPDPNVYSVVGNQLVTPQPLNSSPPPLFNSNPYQFLSRQDTRYSAGLFSHYEVNDAVKLYADFSYMNDRTTEHIAPSAIFIDSNPYNGNTGGSLVNCDNPLLSAQEVGILCAPANIVPGTNNSDVAIGRRNIEGGPRVNFYEHQNYRGVLGVQGSLGDAWTYDAYGSYYYTSLFQAAENYLSWTNIANAVQVGSVNGIPTCTSVVNKTDSKCVPYNIWTQGGVTPAQVQYLASTGIEYGTVQEEIVSGNVTGDLGKYGIKSPAATDPIGVNLGVERRASALSLTPSTNLESGDLSGFGGAVVPNNGSYNVREEFGEIRVPLAQKLPAVYDSVLEAGYRHSDYSTAVGSVNTYKLGLQWAPLQDFRLRWSYQRAIRAPNIIELFNPQFVTNTSVVASDPCAGAAPAASLANCMHTGVTAAQYGHILQCPAGQCAVLDGGNTSLQAEIANTVSLGATITPTFLPNFSASVDYYRISVANEIGAPPISIILNNCLATGSPVSCGQVKRTAVGSLFGVTVAGGGYVSGTFVNIAAVQVSGIDLQATYNWTLPVGGSISANLNGAYLGTDTTTPLPGAHTYDCAGLYGATCATVNPRWRHTLRATWHSSGNLLLSAQWRYIGSVSLDTNTSDATLSNGKFDPFDATLPSMSYLDLSGIWEVRHGVSVRLGVNNVLDKDPPLVSSQITGTGTPNTYNTYDLLGRVCFIGVTAKL